jgi:hypothetical protein
MESVSHDSFDSFLEIRLDLAEILMSPLTLFTVIGAGQLLLAVRTSESGASRVLNTYSTASPAKECSLWTQRVALKRTECQMRCGKRSNLLFRYTKPVLSKEDQDGICGPSRTEFSTDYVRVTNGMRFPHALLREVRRTPISRNGLKSVPSLHYAESPLSCTTIW